MVLILNDQFKDASPNDAQRKVPSIIALFASVSFDANACEDLGQNLQTWKVKVEKNNNGSNICF